jgi:peptide/nickel transport system substrate-binding protein
MSKRHERTPTLIKQRLLPAVLASAAIAAGVAGCGGSSSATGSAGSPADSGASGSAGSSTSSTTSAAAEGTPQYGGTLAFATSAEPICLDPSYEGDDSQDVISRQYLDSLVSVNEDSEYEPWLATSWKITDNGLTYTFQLKHGVKFTDGTDFDSAAVKADVEHWTSPKTESGNIGPALATLKDVATPSKYTVVFQLKTPNSWLLMDLANPAAGIQSPTSLQRPQSQICQDPIGTGPFVVKKWVHGSEVQMTRNDAYTSAPPQAEHTGKAYLSDLDWKFITDAATRYGALQSGNVGIINGIPPESFEAASSDSDYQVFNAQVPGVPQQLDLNTTKAPFDEIDVRKAFLDSADIPDALQSAFFGAYEAPAGVLSPSTPFYDKAFADTYSYNIAEAEKLLDEAGWTKVNSDGYREKDGQVLKVVLPVSGISQTGVGTETEALYEQLQATAKEAGFDLVIETVDSTAASEDESDYNYNLYIDYWTVNTPVALTYVYNSEGVKPASKGAYHNDVSGVDNPEIDKLEAEGLATTDKAEQQKIYSKLQEVITDEALSLQLYIYPLQIAENTSKARGFRFDWAEPVPTLYDTWTPTS